MSDKDRSDDKDRGKRPPTPEELQRDLQEFLKERFGGQISALPFTMTSTPRGEKSRQESEAPPDEPAEEKKVEALRFDLTPARIKEHLDRFVIGQEEAKKTLAVAVCDHYNHVRRVHEGRKSTGSEDGKDGLPDGGEVDHGFTDDYVKQNVILLGPTGVGKTYLLRTIAHLIGVPFVKADITKFSETGYVGGDVDDLIRELVRMADGDVELAEYGIIFLDEIDKIASASSVLGRDVSGRGVQTGLLKLLEETEVAARSPHDISAQFQEMFQMRSGGKPSRKTINTRHVLFVVSGAFSGLDEIIGKRLSSANIGFTVSDPTAELEEGESAFDLVATQDFVDYGFEPEFIGRLPIRVALRDLTENDLFEILSTSEGSILRQHRENFRGYGIEVEFTEDALRAVAARAIQEKTGARGLVTVLETALREFKFRLPETEVRKLLVDREVIESPHAAVERLLADPDRAREAYARFEVEKFVLDFERRHGVRLDLDEASVEMAIGLSRELGVSPGEYLSNTFRSRVDFLVRIAEKAGKARLPVTPQILNNPADGVGVWLGGAAAAGSAEAR